MFDLLDDLNSWIVNHKELLTVIAVPALTFFVTNRVSKASEIRAANERAREREHQRRLKMSEFRQVWINDLRSDLANLIGMTWNTDEFNNKNFVKCYALLSGITMRMNRDDPLYEDLGAAMQDSIHAKDLETLGEAHGRLATCGQAILKQEWDRLKSDLNKPDQFAGKFT